MKILKTFLLGCAVVFAQEFRAVVSGDVTDPSGAAVPGVKIIAESTERKTTYESETNASGRYVTPFLPPGTYNLRFEKAGFKLARRENLALAAVDRLRLDVKLEVGAVADTVNVQSDAELLQTESATNTGTIGQRFIQDVPASGRNLFQFQYTLPGVTKNSNYWGSFELYAFGNINGVSINGGRSGENEVLIDGITSTRGSRSASFAPSLNATQEVSIITNTYDAQYGRVGGGTTSINLKSGTNQLHGELFEYLKNDKLNSNGYSRNAAGLVRPPFKNNTFGFTVDGPVYIPKLFNGRNKLFFVLALEALRERNPQTQLWTVPTAAQRTGDFSQLLTNRNELVAIYDPTAPLGAGNIRVPFAGNRIPTSRLNPVAAKALSFFPLPNRASEGLDGQNNYVFVNSSRNQYDQWLGKMDWSISSKSRVGWRYGQTPWSNLARIQWGNNAAEPSSEHPSTRISRNWGADWTYTISPSMVVNLRGGLARYEGFSGNTFGRGYNPTDLGFPQALVSQFSVLQFPRFNFSGANYSPLGATQTAGYETQDTYSIQPNMSWVRGRQTWKFGTELRQYNSNNHRPGSAAGNYTFGRNWTQRDPQRADALSGNEIATFLTGAITSGSVDNNAWPAYTNFYTAFFFQNDWKITRTVTLNLGMRWDYESPIVERFNRQVNGFAFDQASPLQVPGLNLKGGLIYADSNNRGAFNPDRNNFQPRAGIAWQFRPKWVFRGGYGLSYLGQNAAGPDTGFSRPTPVIASTDNNLTPAAFINDPFPRSLYPSGLLQPIGSSQGLSTNLGQAVAAQIRNRPLPYSQQFSAGFQRTLFNTWLADVSYSANLTSKLPVNVGLNFIPGAELERLPLAERAAYFNQQLPNPLAGRLPGSGLNGATLPRSTLLNAYPHFSGVTLTNLPIGSQNYHSLQAKASRRFASGFAATLAYTWSKTLESVSLLNNQDVNLADFNATRLEQRLQQWDIPHTFTAVASYELPFGKGRKLLSNMNGAGNAIFGGWNVAMEHISRSGVLFDFPNAGPLAARSASLTSDQRNELAKAQGRSEFNPFFDKYYDVTLFPRTAQAPFTQRNFPTRFPDVRSPMLRSWEISAYKEFKFFERVRWQLRADFQNAFDYAYFGQQVTTNVTDPRFGQLNPAQNNQPRIIVAVMKLMF
jgi:hypothetical protein